MSKATIEAQKLKVNKLLKDLEYEEAVLKGMKLASRERPPKGERVSDRILIHGVWKRFFTNVRKSKFTIKDVERYGNNHGTVYNAPERLKDFIRVGYLSYDRDEKVYAFTDKFYNKFSWASSLKEDHKSVLKQITYRKSLPRAS